MWVCRFRKIVCKSHNFCVHKSPQSYNHKHWYALHFKYHQFYVKFYNLLLMLKLFCVPNNLYPAIAVTRCKHTFWPHPQYKPKSVRFRQNNINKQTVTDKRNGMTKCPKSTLSARLVARSFFLHLSAGVFHTYIKTRCCCIVGQCIPCLCHFSSIFGWFSSLEIFSCFGPN